MEIVVLVLGIVGFVMSWVIVGMIPAVLAVILGAFRLLMKKKRLTKLGKTEIIIGMIFALLAVTIALYVYFAGVMDVDFVNIVRQEIDDIKSALPF